MKKSYPLATKTWDEAEYKALQRVIQSDQFTMGKEVFAFEQEFAAYFGAKHAVMVNSGSSANLLIIGAMVYDPRAFLTAGDEVIVPAVSWSTTYYPVHQYGLVLRFVDVDPLTLNMDLDVVARAITPKTKAVFAVNLLGNPCDLVGLKKLCDERGIILLEDNCESMGARQAGKYAGTFGLCGSYSTFFSHHISTMEGGVIVTDDTMVYNTLRSLRAHGWIREQDKDSHLHFETDDFSRLFRFVLPGYNVRPLEMEGALGREQLKKMPLIVEERRKNAALFQTLFSGIPEISIQSETGESSWFGFSMVLKGRAAGGRQKLVTRFKGNDIDVRPIVAGNFLNNPVIKHLQVSMGSDIIHADDLDQNGLFIGNHHYDITDELKLARKVVGEFLDNDI